ncbi:hypothetical protein [Arenibacter certesii]|uniref:Nicotinate-nucleotide adenylyltransferase n=1 Tax=Arenibacter certesii TaxID=228955 RepID=A0A918ITX4_9FLAO|nr:hypothetical protein [Arenibacter certesii]GGW32529.1 hypothetical protein GCM10007383_17070 [Arenibacter certesii]
MKKSFILIALMGFISIGFSQTNGNKEDNHDEHSNAFELEGVTISPISNLVYHNMVSNEATPEFVQNLQKEVANYDVTEDPNFDGNYDDYKVIFSQTNGRIIATYDAEGKVLSTIEKFKNVTPPNSVRDEIYKQYPDWIIQKDIYRVTYFKDKGVNKTYQVQVQNGNSKKNLRVDYTGEIH